MPTFAITLASRQTPSSKFSHWEIPDVELIARVSKALPDAKEGYRDGVLEVPISPDGFFSPVVKLQDGDKCTSTYESRKPEEEPRKSVRRLDSTRGKSAAVAVDVILYRHDVLGDEAGSDADWEIISVNARVTKDPEPIHPDTLIANHYELDGGTPTNMRPIEFVAALRTSVLYWKNHAHVEQSDYDEDTRLRSIEAARRIHQEGSDNSIEIDDGAKLSVGCDPGHWVGAWVWVYDTDWKTEEELEGEEG